MKSYSLLRPSREIPWGAKDSPILPFHQEFCVCFANFPAKSRVQKTGWRSKHNLGKVSEVHPLLFAILPSFHHQQKGTRKNGTGTSLCKPTRAWKKNVFLLQIWNVKVSFKKKRKGSWLWEADREVLRHVLRTRLEENSLKKMEFIGKSLHSENVGTSPICFLFQSYLCDFLMTTLCQYVPQARSVLCKANAT